MQVIDLLDPQRVVTEVDLTSKEQLLEYLARLIAASGGGAVEGQILDSLRARERLGSTGLGHGVAIPHGRGKAIPAACGAFVRLAKPIEFNAMDGQPVDLIAALVVPEHFTNQHLLLLAQLAEMFSEAGFLERLRAAPDAPALFAALAEWRQKRH